MKTYAHSAITTSKAVVGRAERQGGKWSLLCRASPVSLRGLRKSLRVTRQEALRAANNFLNHGMPFVTIYPIRRIRCVGAPHFHRVCYDLTDSCHFAAFAILGALFCFAYPRHIALVCLVVFGSALLLEFMQLLTPDRHGRIHDAIEKMTGGSAGLVTGRAILLSNKVRRLLQK